SQTLIVRSAPAVARRPLGAKASAVRSPPSALIRSSSLPVSASQTFTVPPALARRRPSRLKQRPAMLRGGGCHDRNSLPSRADHTLTMPSASALASRPSGAKVTRPTVALWPAREAVRRPVLTSHRYSSPAIFFRVRGSYSPLPLARDAPSGLNARQVT